MVVEDDPAVLVAVGDFLRAAGFTVHQIADGSRASDVLRSAAPDLVVLDRMVPGVDGDQLCRQIRADIPLTPVIMLTALDSVDDRIAGLESGADDYLAKPFALRELQLRIDALLRRSHGRQPISAFSSGPFGSIRAASGLPRWPRNSAHHKGIRAPTVLPSAPRHRVLTRRHPA